MLPLNAFSTGIQTLAALSMLTNGTSTENKDRNGSLVVQQQQANNFEPSTQFHWDNHQQREQQRTYLQHQGSTGRIQVSQPYRKLAGAKSGPKVAKSSQIGAKSRLRTPKQTAADSSPVLDPGGFRKRRLPQYNQRPQRPHRRLEVVNRPFQGGVLGRDLAGESQLTPATTKRLLTPNNPQPLQFHQQPQIKNAPPQIQQHHSKGAERRAGIGDYWNYWFSGGGDEEDEDDEDVDGTGIGGGIFGGGDGGLGFGSSNDDDDLLGMKKRRLKKRKRIGYDDYDEDFGTSRRDSFGRGHHRTRTRLTPLDSPPMNRHGDYGDYYDDDEPSSSAGFERRHYHSEDHGYGTKSYKHGGPSNIYVYPAGHGGGGNSHGFMDAFLYKMEGILDKMSYHHQPHYHAPQKKDDMSLAPLLLTLPLLLGLGALLFAAQNGSNTVVNVNVNTTQTNTNGRSLDFGGFGAFGSDAGADVLTGDLLPVSDLFVVPKLMPEEADGAVNFVEDGAESLSDRAFALMLRYGKMRVADVLASLPELIPQYIPIWEDDGGGGGGGSTTAAGGMAGCTEGDSSWKCVFARYTSPVEKGETATDLTTSSSVRQPRKREKQGNGFLGWLFA